MNSPLALLYETQDEQRAFMSRFCGPDSLPHGVETLIANYPIDDGGDGQTVEVFATAYPATFYRLKVHPGVNSLGEQMAGYEISTGTGARMLALAARLAEAIADGMIGFKAKGGAA